MANNIPKYEQLAQQVIDKVLANALKTGDKLPSLRLFSSQQNVSINTAIRCYEFLEDQGVVQAIPKKGFVVKSFIRAATFPKFPQFIGNVTTLSQRVFRPINKSSYSHTKNTSLVPTVMESKALLSAQLCPDLLPLASLRNSFNRFFHTNNLEHLLYGNNESSYLLAEALSQHFLKQGFALDTETLQVSNGCIDAVSTALNVVSKPGDTIAINSPCFNGLLELLALLDRKVIEIPSTEQGLDVEQLSSLVKTHEISACLFTANFQNPTGHSLSVEQKKWLAQFAADNEIPIIEDDVFIELNYQRGLPLPIKHWDKEGWVLWCGSISKTLAPGLRLGWCSAGRFSQAFEYHSKVLSLGVNQPVQRGIADFINKGHYARHVKKLNKILHHQMLEYRTFLRTLLPSNTVISDPLGGIVLWIQIPNLNAQKLVHISDKKGVYVRSGNVFSTGDFYDDCFRINTGWPLSSDIKRQLESIALTIHNLQKTTVK